MDKTDETLRSVVSLLHAALIQVPGPRRVERPLSGTLSIIMAETKEIVLAPKVSSLKSHSSLCLHYWPEEVTWAIPLQIGEDMKGGLM